MRLAAVNLLMVNELPLVLGMPYYKLVQMEAEELNGLMRNESPIEEYQRGKIREMGTNARICPECIAEDIPATSTMSAHLPLPCERHNLMPIDECEGCKTVLSFKRSRIEYCDCGFPLKNAKRVLTPDWLPEFFRKYSFGGKPVENEFDESERKRCHLTAKVVGALLSDSENALPYGWISLKEFLRFERFVTDWPVTLREYIHSLSHEENNAHTKAVVNRICKVKNTTLAKAVHSIWDEVRTDLDGARRLVFKQNDLVDTASVEEASQILGTDINFTMHLWWSRWFHAAELEVDLWTPRFDREHLTDTLNGLRNRCLPGDNAEPNLSRIWHEFRKKTVRPCANLLKMAINPADWPLYSTVANPKIDDMTSRMTKWISLSRILPIAERLFRAAVK